jgi:hypothetical protein
MLRLTTLTGCTILLAAFLVGTGRSGDGKAGPTKKAYLPKYWSRLGLSADQKSKILKLRGDYATKIAALKEQIEKLTKEERSKSFALLTEEQKEHLRKIITEKAGGAPDTVPDKKKGTDKKKGAVDKD